MRKAIVLATVLSLGFSLNCFAAKEPAKPAAVNQTKESKEAKTIFSFKDELSLSDKQIESIKSLLAELQSTMNEKAKSLNTLRQELSAMLKDRDSLKVIKVKLEQIADVQVDASYIDVDISRKVEDVLTSDQMKKWKDIQQKARDEAMKEMQALNKEAPKAK